MAEHVVLMTIPGLRDCDLVHMPRLGALAQSGQVLPLSINFPAVTWPSQATMLTGKSPQQHGVIANGFYWRQQATVEMWTAWNDKIESPQLWDLLRQREPSFTSAAWFPMLSKGCSADYVCMPAPVHNPDGSESMWCYSKPQPFYAELLDRLGHFPLQHFWGPMANIKSTDWIVDSAVIAFQRFHPNFFYIYLPHLDYAAQKFGPNSAEAQRSLIELDAAIGRLVEGVSAERNVCWLAVSEYVIGEVSHVSYPNRTLNEAGLLSVDPDGQIDFVSSLAWCLVDHQFSHVFVRDHDPTVIHKVKALFTDQQGIEVVALGKDRAALGLDHPRAGDLVLVSSPHSWQAYYWWLDDADAPPFARTVDIHRKPGYDPAELCWDRESNSVPLNAELIKGSHGVATRPERGGVFVHSAQEQPRDAVTSRDVCNLVLAEFAR